MASECVVDTTVLQKANAPLTQTKRGPGIIARLRLLEHIREGKATLLWSKRLVYEYSQRVATPRNDYIKVFLALIADGNAIMNYAKWPTRLQEKARKCRYPAEDDHVLRTAIRPNGSTIFSEEKGMLSANECIYRHFRVRISEP